MKIRIEISPKWVEKLKNKDGMPLSKIAQFLRSEFVDNIVCVEKSFYILDLTFDSSKKGEIIETLSEFVHKEFKVKNVFEVFTITDISDGNSKPIDKTGLAIDESPAKSEEKGAEEDGSGLFSVKKTSDASDSSTDGSADSGDSLKGEGIGSMGGKGSFFDSVSKPDDIDEGKLAGAEGEDSALSGGFGSKLSKGGILGGGGSSSSGASSFVSKVDELIGAEQFKTLCHEIANIAPLVKENGAIDCITNQSYIFSINDGYGLSTALSLFAGILGSSGLRRMNEKSVVELKIPYKADGDRDPFEGPRSILNDIVRTNISNNQNAVICLDLSEWMTNINNRSLRAFIRDYSKFSVILTIVYRIPYVNEETFTRVKDSLSDMAFVRGIQFPTLSQEQLRLFAENNLKKYGFSLSEDAWERFDAKIFEEKKDGRFYGFSTVLKVVSELLYNKHIVCASGDRTNKVISSAEVDQICSHVVEEEIGMDHLNNMVGGDKIRARLDEIIAQIEVARITGAGTPCIHMRFIGNPGTGKTTVARIIGKVLKEKGVLRLGGFFEYSGRDFCGRYIGETAPKTAGMCRDAYGSILFIDEAYSLYRGDDNDKDYGREALDTLIAEMENNRSDLLVIMAGYPVEMEKLMEGNQGLASRMPYVLEFPNFNRDELVEIFKRMVKAPYVLEDGVMEKVSEYFKTLPQTFIESKQFSNARYVRNLYERTLAKTAMRRREASEKIVITKEDFELASTDKEFRNFESKTRKIGFR